MVETLLSGGLTGAVVFWDPKQLASAQAADSELAVVYELRQNSEDLPPWSKVIEHNEATKEYWKQSDVLKLHYGVLYRKLIRGNRHV